MQFITAGTHFASQWRVLKKLHMFIGLLLTFPEPHDYPVIWPFVVFDSAIPEVVHSSIYTFFRIVLLP